MSSKAPTIASNSGFTLLELLLAIVIFAIVSAMAYGGLNTVSNARQKSELRSEQFTQLQMAFTFMMRDIEQIVNRKIRNEYGEIQHAVIGNNFDGYLLELSRTGWRNPANLSRSNLQRVAYGLEEHKLIRAYWNTLDRSEDSQAIKTVLLEDVDEVVLKYMGDDGEWRGTWPDDLTGENPDSGPPKAIQVEIETKRFGKLTRLFRIVHQQ